MSFQSLFCAASPLQDEYSWYENVGYQTSTAIVCFMCFFKARVAELGMANGDYVKPTRSNCEWVVDYRVFTPERSGPFFQPQHHHPHFPSSWLFYIDEPSWKKQCFHYHTRDGVTDEFWWNFKLVFAEPKNSQNMRQLYAGAASAF